MFGVLIVEKIKTVKKRIFLSNAIMMFVTLWMFLIVNICVVKIYSESIEHEFNISAENITDGDELKKLVEDWTIERNDFLLLFAADGIICIGVLFAVSQLFTGNLTKHILKPLEMLDEGAKRVREGNLDESINYKGDVEFETVCESFNSMQKHILDEQVKNRKYEKARTEMIMGISHDMRTPLTAAKGAVKAVIDGIADTEEKRKMFLEIAYKRTEDMDKLLEQLFYVSKMETGGIALNIKNTDLAEFIENYVCYKKDLIDGDIVFENNLKENLYTDIDIEQMRRIFDNLTENSIKYNDKEKTKINISLEKTDNDIIILFSDNGNGVPEEKIKYVFDEFYRCDESRNIKGGSGLGLYIVKCLVEQMKGKIKAYNKNGFVVEITLPIAKKV